MWQYVSTEVESKISKNFSLFKTHRSEIIDRSRNVWFFFYSNKRNAICSIYLFSVYIYIYANRNMSQTWKYGAVNGNFHWEMLGKFTLHSFSLNIPLVGIYIKIQTMFL